MRFIFFVLLIICENHCFSQNTSENIKRNDFQLYLTCDLFEFELVAIEECVFSCLDTIVKKGEPESNVYWYLDFSIEKSNHVLTLSKSHIEQFALYNKTHNITNKALVVNGLVVFVRDNEEFKTKAIKSMKVTIENPKSLDNIYFIDYPYWKFRIKDSEMKLIKRVQFR